MLRYNAQRRLEKDIIFLGAAAGRDTNNNLR